MSKKLDDKLFKAREEVSNAKKYIHELMDKIPYYKISTSDRYEALEAALDCLQEADKQIDYAMGYVYELPRR